MSIYKISFSKKDESEAPDQEDYGVPRNVASNDDIGEDLNFILCCKSNS